MPLLLVRQPDGREVVLFESAVICEYLEDTETDTPLHPADPLQRARYPGWMEFGSSILGDLWEFQNGEGCRDLRDETQGTDRKILASETFSLVDAVFAPIFRYFDTFDLMTPTGVFDGLSKVARWRAALAARPSGKAAVAEDYAERLKIFLAQHDAWLLKLAA